MRRWWLHLAAVVAAGGARDGYLFVTNRGDEAVAACARLRAVAPAANVTLVADAATLRDVGAAARCFDVVLAAERAMPDLDVHDSQGFRLQKLRGMRLSPYARTLYMDSDTYACRDPAPLFDVVATADVACVWGGRGNHSGASAGVLAYRASAASDALWRHWERIYRTVMRETRREQPSFQRALAATAALTVAKLPMVYNCRNVRHCGAATLKDGTRTDGCVVIHAHDFAAPAAPPPPRAAAPVSRGACPVLSGAHRVVLFLAPPGAGLATRKVLDAAATLKVDNDFSVCGTLDAPNIDALAACVDKSNKYAVVVAGNFAPPRGAVFGGARGGRAAAVVAVARDPRERYAKLVATAPPDKLAAVDACLARPRAPPTAGSSCFEAELGVADDGDVAWFCGDACAGLDAGADRLAAALRVARAFVVVGAARRPRDLVRELERALPSHFLRLGRAPAARGLRESDALARAARRTGHAKLVRVDRAAAAAAAPPEPAADAREAAFLAANALDAQFYAAVDADLDARRACPGVD